MKAVRPSPRPPATTSEAATDDAAGGQAGPDAQPGAPYMRRRSTATAPRAEPEAASAAKKLAEKVMRTTGTSLGDERFGRPLNPLGEKTLEHIAESLRRYPEVEWACELSDSQGRPLIGLRVDPAFQNRASEISDLVVAAASERKVTVQVALLTETAKLREARTVGVVFYPWRKK